MTTHVAVPLIVSELARRRMGIFTTADLAARGVGEREIRTAVRSGNWVRLRTGVFITADDLAEVERTDRRPGLDALAVTTSLARSSAALSGATAAWVWGLPRPHPSPRTVHLTDPHRWRRGRGWLMTHAGLPDDEMTMRGAYRVTTPARTVVDVARAWPEVHAVAAVDAALLRRLTSRDELSRVLDRQASVPGIPRSVRVALADGRAESWLETWGRLTFAALGLPPFAPQVELWTDGRLVKVVDGWYADAAVAVEFDGRVKYRHARYGRTPEDELWREKRDEDLLRSFGVRFVRVAAGDLALSRRVQLDRLVRRQLATEGPRMREFREIARTAGRWRGDHVEEDGWLPRADDGVGGRPSG